MTYEFDDGRPDTITIPVPVIIGHSYTDPHSGDPLIASLTIKATASVIPRLTEACRDETQTEIIIDHPSGDNAVYTDAFVTEVYHPHDLTGMPFVEFAVEYDKRYRTSTETDQ